jgi:uncharacterized membrane protein
MRPYIVWPWVSGLTTLAVGLFVARRELAAGRGLDTLVVLGPLFVAAPLAVFGAEHFTVTQGVMGLIPSWMPAHMFLAYFVGCCLYAAAASLVLRRDVWLSASCLALMFVIFVTTMHLPGALRGSDRFAWIVSLRDLSFGGGAMCLAGAAGAFRRADGSSWLSTAGRVIVGTALVVFGVVHILYPANAPGVPLQKMMPPWLPLPAVWGYVTGAMEISAGALIVANRQARAAAAWTGLLVTILVLVVYTPFLGVAVEGGEKLEALNYIWDTLLFAGTVLAVAARQAPLERRARSRSEPPSPKASPLAKRAPLAEGEPYLTPGGAVTLLYS